MDGRFELPDYGGACLSSVMPFLLPRLYAGEDGPVPAWVPEPLLGARQVVLLVLDGLGERQLRRYGAHMPVLSGFAGGAITSVAPTTTAAALTSLVTGLPPAQHGLLGYRMRVGNELLNVLRWSTAAGDARTTIPPRRLQPHPAFLGYHPPVVTPVGFAGSGFTEAHQDDAHLVGWWAPSSIRVEVAELLSEGAPFVYAYYDGIDRIAHERGIGEHYLAELETVDRLVADVLEAMPPGSALAVTADHGQFPVPCANISLDAEVQRDVEAMSGEGRFRWLHARPGTGERLRASCEEHYGAVALVATAEELIELDYFGGEMTPAVRSRLGDVALVARGAVSFDDPESPSEAHLVGRHGSLSDEELYVPFLGRAR